MHLLCLSCGITQSAVSVLWYYTICCVCPVVLHNLLCLSCGITQSAVSVLWYYTICCVCSVVLHNLLCLSCGITQSAVSSILWSVYIVLQREKKRRRQQVAQLRRHLLERRDSQRVHPRHLGERNLPFQGKISLPLCVLYMFVLMWGRVLCAW